MSKNQMEAGKLSATVLQDYKTQLGKLVQSKLTEYPQYFKNYFKEEIAISLKDQFFMIWHLTYDFKTNKNCKHWSDLCNISGLDSVKMQICRNKMSLNKTTEIINLSVCIYIFFTLCFLKQWLLALTPFSPVARSRVN